MREIRDERSALPQIETGTSGAGKSGETSIGQVGIDRIVLVVFDPAAELQRRTFELEFFEPENGE